MAFTEQEKARIKHHLGYPDWVQLSNSIQLGFPAGAHPLFLLEQAFQRLTVGGEGSVRADLCECEAIEGQLRSARSRMKASKMGELTLNADESMQLRNELQFWRTRLADDLGVTQNPMSQAAMGGDPGGVNSRVIG